LTPATKSSNVKLAVDAAAAAAAVCVQLRQPTNQHAPTLTILLLLMA
jgi:hypothetical protein